MKEHTQTMGIRKWAGDDLIELQKEPLDALQALVEPYAPCIIQGCIPTPDEDGKTYTVSPGFVALKGKIVRFDGKTKANLPLYLGLDCKTENRAYADGGNKPIKYQYVAKELNEDTADDSCLTITADDSANPHLVDTLGITQKLDRVGGDASHVKVAFKDEGTDTKDFKSGNTLAKMFAGIKKWLDGKVDKIDGKGLSEANFTKEEKEKLQNLKIGLDGFSIYKANYNGIDTSETVSRSIDTYFPDTVLNGRSLQVGDLFIANNTQSYLFRVKSISGTTFTATYLASLRGETGETGPQGAEGLGIWRSTTSTSTSTSSIALSTITIPTGRSVKVGDLIIANATYSYLYRVTAVSSTTATVTYLTSLRGATGAQGAQGAAGTNATTTAVATTSTNGLMSKEDKSKLDNLFVASGFYDGSSVTFLKGSGTVTTSSTGLYMLSINGNLSGMLLVTSTNGLIARYSIPTNLIEGKTRYSINLSTVTGTATNGSFRFVLLTV